MANVSAHGFATTKWIESEPSIAIPVFQREYRWTQETCHQLIRDIRAVAVAEEGHTHFIGSILGSADDGGGVTLVDGQQRITTLMLLMAALRDLAKPHDEPLAERISAVLVSPEDPKRPRLQPHEQNVAVVQELMTSTPTALGESAFERNYAFFLGELADDWRLVWEGVQRLEHVGITLGPTSNAQRIFESLNSTGARLTDDELIHNYIHMGRTRREQDSLEADVWLPIESATKGATREFWRDYLVATSTQQPDFAGDFGVYRAFARRYPDPTLDLTKDATDDWVRFARLYGVLLSPSLESDAEVREQLDLIAMFEGGPRPLMLMFYGDLRTGRIDKPTFIETAERLQSMWIRSAVVGRPVGLDAVGAICREVPQSGYPLDRLVARTPEDLSVRLRLTYAAVPNVGYVLRRLQQPPREAHDLQIEHIYPQTPKDSWSGDGGKTTWGDLTNDEQARYRTVLHTIGNLTLLEAPLNQGAGNNSFLVKARDYYPRSDVRPTRDLASKESWDYEQITQRTASLTERFLEIWTRPSDIKEEVPDDLIRVVDFSVPAGMGDPEVFEYVLFGDERWDDVRNVKDLLARIGYTLYLRDPRTFAATALGRLVHTTRTRHTKYVTLPDGQLLYAAWAPQYILEAIQDTLTEYDLHDHVRVKPVSHDLLG